MEIFPNLMTLPPASTAYFLFFCVCVGLLLLIAAVKAPEVIRSILRFMRQMRARKTRGERMLADLEKLKRDSRDLEGVYCFEAIQPHFSPDHTESATSVASSVPSR
jgi:Sec-independent protein translocase protein TatA